MYLQKLRLGIGLAALGMCLLILLFWFDFSDTSWKNNRGGFIGLATGLLSSISSLISYSKDKQKTEIS